MTTKNKTIAQPVIDAVEFVPVLTPEQIASDKRNERISTFLQWLHHAISDVDVNSLLTASEQVQIVEQVNTETNKLQSAYSQYESLIAVPNASDALKEAAKAMLIAQGYTGNKEEDVAKLPTLPTLTNTLEYVIVNALNSALPQHKASASVTGGRVRPTQGGTKLKVGQYDVIGFGENNPMTGNKQRANMFNAARLRLIVEADKVRIFTDGELAHSLENKYTLDKLAKEYIIPSCGGSATSKISGADMAQHFGLDLSQMQE